jgi:hypothetical protein
MVRLPKGVRLGCLSPLKLKLGRSIMTFRRRAFTPLAAGGAALPAMPGLMGEWLSGRLGQQFFVDYRTGAIGNIGTEAVDSRPSEPAIRARPSVAETTKK